MVTSILVLLICSISIQIVYSAYSIYNEYLRSKVLKSRARKLAELDEILDVQKFAEKLEERMDKREMMKKRFKA
ncbi:hypothetical protein [Sediminibacillus massiliensis]|uniref:hypothetical protein n=1 Tax=Sediminibacillus massiliensis TaxID=1926277 RepID=UPI00098832F3|nr:hypothetical protein [Sediminibacillus massiliensis]